MRGDNSLKNTEFSKCVEKARKGDADAFAELYSLVYKDLYRIALMNLNNNQHDASDVVSDTVLDAYSSIKKLKDESAFKAWIIKILTVKIKNKQREYIERNNYRKELDDIEGVEQEKSAEINYNGLEIMEEFAKLGEEERLVLSLSVVSGYKSEEIARMTGISANTVRSKVARAKIKLKQMLTER
ncbi:MAG: sigma-70 family RNA polymerase sigma factor [Oscillospiraceae bacterium]|nr:sigma-70 family RNA polymerase sigma factor [Oscillospiraceae bacterium]